MYHGPCDDMLPWFESLGYPHTRGEASIQEVSLCCMYELDMLPGCVALRVFALLVLLWFEFLGYPHTRGGGCC